jgi:FAD/FMN-containing dehydrogenase
MGQNLQPVDTLNLEEEIINDFEASLRGKLIRPDSSEYDEVRTIYNAMIDKHPGLIVKCSNVADVISAVDFGREHNLDTAVRGGGHNGPGLALVNDGLVIDLSEMKGIRVDPQKRTVRVEAGCTWGDVAHATHAFGMATVSGVISTTGVAGLTLGGGHGYLTRKYGLTIDSLLSADVVLADGRLVHASEDENEDLFWALRGGGGNFGVVTSFKFKMHPVQNVVCGPMFWPVDQTEKMMHWYRDFITNVPNDIYAFFMVGEVPPAEPFPEDIHGEKVCGLLWCCTGTPDKSEPFLQQARDVEKPLFEFTGEMPYPALQTMFDDLYPEGMQWYWKGDFIRELSDKAIEAHLDYAEVPTMHSTMHLYPVNGAVHDVDADETAWNYRDVNWSMVIAGVSPDPSDKEKITQWARNYWEAIHPYSAGAAYLNFMMEEGDERIRATFGKNYSRLQKVKKKYDPDNFFHINQNIEPE